MTREESGGLSSTVYKRSGIGMTESDSIDDVE